MAGKVDGNQDSSVESKSRKNNIIFQQKQSGHPKNTPIAFPNDSGVNDTSTKGVRIQMLRGSVHWPNPCQRPDGSCWSRKRAYLAPVTSTRTCRMGISPLRRKELIWQWDKKEDVYYKLHKYKIDPPEILSLEDTSAVMDCFLSSYFFLSRESEIGGQMM